MNIVTPEEAGLSSNGLEQLCAKAQDFVDKGKLAGLITLISRRALFAGYDRR